MMVGANLWAEATKSTQLLLSLPWSVLEGVQRKASQFSTLLQHNDSMHGCKKAWEIWLSFSFKTNPLNKSSSTWNRWKHSFQNKIISLRVSLSNHIVLIIIISPTPSLQHIIICIVLCCYFAAKWWMRRSAALHNLCHHLHKQTAARESWVPKVYSLKTLLPVLLISCLIWCLLTHLYRSAITHWPLQGFELHNPFVSQWTKTLL